MDMITLAMAKAYTDEKVANGGASGGVCLPVVEITSAVYPAPGDNPVFLSEAEGSALTAVSDMGIPCIIKFTANNGEADIPIVGVFHWVNSAYAMPWSGDYSFAFIPVENYWVMGG